MLARPANARWTCARTDGTARKNSKAKRAGGYADCEGEAAAAEAEPHAGECRRKDDDGPHGDGGGQIQAA